jgi:hypothetical protein
MDAAVRWASSPDPWKWAPTAYSGEDRNPGCATPRGWSRSEWISVADVRQSYWRTTDEVDVDVDASAEEVETDAEAVEVEPLTQELAEEAWAPEVHRILTRVAGTYQGLIEYAELGAEVQEAAGIRSSRPVRSWIGPVLCRVAQENHARNEPALTSLVVHKADGIVGVGYDEALTLAGIPPIEDPVAREKHAAQARLECYRWAGATMPASGGRAAVSPRFEQIQARLRKERRAAEQPTICTSCYMAIPPTGVCDNCG